MGSRPDTGLLFAGSLRTTSSTYVFHAPQDGHFPTHLGESCPQLVHTYTVFPLPYSYGIIKTAQLEAEFVQR